MVEKYKKEFEQVFDNVDIRESTFFGEPWLYIKCYHNGKAIIYDISVKTFKVYGTQLELLKKEWCRLWGDW